jgi:hypothetical protein
MYIHGEGRKSLGVKKFIGIILAGEKKYIYIWS